jgi:hypothetical protein
MDRRDDGTVPVTTLHADERCESSGGLLVSPHVIPFFGLRLGADYVWLTCGRPYRWVGNPPRLLTTSVAPLQLPSNSDCET